jgi:hypothetical protein
MGPPVFRLQNGVGANFAEGERQAESLTYKLARQRSGVGRIANPSCA